MDSIHGSPEKHHVKAGAILKRVKSFNNRYFRGSVFAGDAIDFLETLPDGCASLVFIDPPFNLGKKYSSANPQIDSRTDGDYRSWLILVLRESERILKEGGTLYLYHLPKWAMRMGPELEAMGLEFRHWVAVSMKNGFVRGRRLYPAHYALLMFTKGEPLYFERPRLKPQRCRHCNGYIKDYGGYLSIVEEKGLNLSDVWEDLSPVRHKNRKNRSANELSSDMMNRIFSISGHRGELFVDPFVGAGSSALAAGKKGMKFSVCDIVRDNCEIASSRLADVYKELLRGGKIGQS